MFIVKKSEIGKPLEKYTPRGASFLKANRQNWSLKSWKYLGVSFRETDPWIMNLVGLGVVWWSRSAPSGAAWTGGAFWCNTENFFCVQQQSLLLFWISWCASLKSSSWLCHWYFLMTLKLIIPNPSCWLLCLSLCIPERLGRKWPTAISRNFCEVGDSQCCCWIPSRCLSLFWQGWVPRQWAEDVTSERVKSIRKRWTWILQDTNNYLVFSDDEVIYFY